MIRKERDRLTIMVGIKRQELTLVAAAQVMDLSYRQAKRMWRWYIRPTATPGWPATTNATRTSAPTLAAEYLAQDDGLQVDHETLRRWLLAEGKRTVRTRPESTSRA
jgi:hypothetical protein